MTGCLFCKISAKEIPAEVVYEDDRTVAFLDVHPKAPGHILVIPKEHAGTVLDLPESNFTPLLKAIAEVQRMILRSLKPDGFSLGINQGRISGQEIDHLHVHVIPRFSGDGGESFQSIVSNAPKESIKEIASKLKA